MSGLSSHHVYCHYHVHCYCSHDACTSLALKDAKKKRDADMELEIEKASKWTQRPIMRAEEGVVAVKSGTRSGVACTGVENRRERVHFTSIRAARGRRAEINAHTPFFRSCPLHSRGGQLSQVVCGEARSCGNSLVARIARGRQRRLCQERRAGVGWRWPGWLPEAAAPLLSDSGLHLFLFQFTKLPSGIPHLEGAPKL
jgi:hypothetical protein